MAHYSHSHTDDYERAERRHGHAGLVLTGIALLMLTALAWVWTQGSGADPTMAQTQAPPAARIAPSATPPAPVNAAAATVAPAPAVAPSAALSAATASSGVLTPPSDAVAAAGDTRAAR